MVFDPDIPFGVVRRQTKELANKLLLLDGGEIQDGSMLKRLIVQQKEVADQAIPILTEAPLPPAPAWDLLAESHDYSSSSSGTLPLPERSVSPETEQRSDRKFLIDLEETIQSREHIHPVFEKMDIKPEAIQEALQPEKSQITSLNEFIPDALYDLTYTFLMIPRFSTHRLKTDETATIKEFIKNLHLSYGWRLELLDMQPEYLRWASSFPPNIAPSSHLEMIRKGTSKQLFEDIPGYKKENLSGDYWAPGYIIVEGKNSISTQLVSDYIIHNRQKHGIRID